MNRLVLIVLCGLVLLGPPSVLVVLTDDQRATIETRLRPFGQRHGHTTA